MKVDLSKFEIELLDQALDCWEKEPERDGFLQSLMAGALLKDEARAEGFAEKQKLSSEKAKSKRRFQGTMLRAKLFQALAIDSEHTLEENPVTPPQVENKL